MHLFRKKLLAKSVERNELSRQRPGFQKAFSDQHDLANQAQVGDNHGAGPEEGLKVLGQLGSARVARVHGDEDPDGRVQRNFLSHEVKGLLALFNLILQKKAKSDFDIIKLFVSFVESPMQRTIQLAVK